MVVKRNKKGQFVKGSKPGFAGFAEGFNAAAKKKGSRIETTFNGKTSRATVGRKGRVRHKRK